MKRSLFVLLALLALAGSAFAQDFIIANGAEPSTLDPALMQDTTSNQFYLAMFEDLFSMIRGPAREFPHGRKLDDQPGWYDSDLQASRCEVVGWHACHRTGISYMDGCAPSRRDRVQLCVHDRHGGQGSR